LSSPSFASAENSINTAEREVAIKILRFDFVNDIDFIRRFRREAQSASSLDHPNIVSIYDIGEEGDIYYIVMGLISRCTIWF
jgi:serine/threonine protein kinase